MRDPHLLDARETAICTPPCHGPTRPSSPRSHEPAALPRPPKAPLSPTPQAPARVPPGRERRLVLPPPAQAQRRPKEEKGKPRLRPLPKGPPHLRRLSVSRSPTSVRSPVHSPSLPALHKTRHGWQLRRGPSQKGKVSPRRRRARFALRFPIRASPDHVDPEQLKSKSSVPDTKPDLPPVPTCKSPSLSADHFISPRSAAEPFSTNDPLFNVPFDPNFAFGSEAANLEYSILSAILGNPSPPDSASAAAPSPSQPQLQPSVPNSAWSPEPLHAQPHYPPPPQQPYPFTDPPRLSMPEPTLAATAHPSPTTAFISYSPTQFSRPSQDSPADLPYPTSYPQGSTPSVPPRYSRDPTTTASVRLHSREAGPHSLEPSAHPSPTSTSSTPHSSMDHFSVCRLFFVHGLSAEHVSAAPRHSPVRLYRGLSFPHETSSEPVSTSPCAQAWHMHGLGRSIPDDPPCWNVLGDRFEKNDILRIVRALAIFRPSLIALQMPMTDEDEVFVERCFQRSLLVRFFFPIRPMHVM